jgi:hypothetical protein
MLGNRRKIMAEEKSIPQAQTAKAATVETKVETKVGPSEEEGRVEYVDYWHPKLKEGRTPVQVTLEQWYCIDRALEKAASDNQFADKAKEAVRFILLGAPEAEPTEKKK